MSKSCKFGVVEDKRGRGDVVFSIESMAAVCARRKPKTFFCTFLNPPETDILPFLKGIFLSYSKKKHRHKGNIFAERKTKDLADVLFLKHQR